MTLRRVARVVNTHGIRGEVRVLSTTDFPDKRFRQGNVLYLRLPDQSGQIPLTVRRSRPHKQFWILGFEEADSINQVESWKGGSLLAETSREDLSEHEFYFDEIIGLTVVTDEGRQLGQVAEILQPGANDVWVVRDGQKEWLIPYIEPVVKEVDLDRKRVVITPLPGLLEDEDEG